MENKRTLDEFFIQKYEKLEEENKVLEERQEKLLEINDNLGDERDEWKNKYYELVNKLKEDLVPEIKKATTNNQHYIDIRTYKLWEDYPETYEYYKKLFNLKEEGEEENE